MAVWWVFQNQSYERSRDGGYPNDSTQLDLIEGTPYKSFKECGVATYPHKKE
jgi:hypothetical protein